MKIHLPCQLCISKRCVCVYTGLSEDYNSKDYKPGASPLCFIEQLCELHHGEVLEAKGVKEHFWKPFIKKLFERKVRNQDHAKKMKL